MINPWVIIGAICVVLGTYKYGTHSGYKQREAEMQAEIARLNEESRAKEQKLAQDLNNTSSQLKEANDVVTKKQTDLDAAIRAGRVRLNSSSCLQPTENSTSSARDSTDGAESDRETIRLIAQIVAEGDKAINRLNACIAAYEQVREAINGNK